jgi:hypothetical protein
MCGMCESVTEPFERLVIRWDLRGLHDELTRALIDLDEAERLTSRRSYAGT